MLHYCPNEIDATFRNRFVIDEKISKIKWQVQYYRYIDTDIEFIEDEIGRILEDFAKYRIGLLEKELSGVSKLVRMNKENWLNYLCLRNLALFFQTEIFCSKPAIYLDVEGILHIYARHEASLKKIKYPNEKTEFNYSGKDIILLLKQIIDYNFVSELQKHKAENPNKDYGKTISYNGDIYKIQISTIGKINKFHRL